MPVEVILACEEVDHHEREEGCKSVPEPFLKEEEGALSKRRTNSTAVFVTCSEVVGLDSKNLGRYICQALR